MWFEFKLLTENIDMDEGKVQTRRPKKILQFPFKSCNLSLKSTPKSFILMWLPFVMAFWYIQHLKPLCKFAIDIFDLQIRIFKTKKHIANKNDIEKSEMVSILGQSQILFFVCFVEIYSMHLNFPIENVLGYSITFTLICVFTLCEIDW